MSHDMSACPASSDIFSLVLYDDDADVDTSALRHLESCDACHEEFLEYHQVAEAIASVTPQDFVRWYSFPLPTSESLCIVVQPDAVPAFEVLDGDVEIENHLGRRFDGKLLVRDPALREIGLAELQRGALRSPREFERILRAFEGPAPEYDAIISSARVPFVSVILPTYNQASMLNRALRSALEQSYEAFEVIVVDDGSTDHTSQVLARWTHDRIRYRRLDSNRGPAAARNEGLKAVEEAQADIVAFLDSDDQWMREYLARMIHQLLISPPRVGGAYCDMWLMGAEGEAPRLYESPEVRHGTTIDGERGYNGTGIHMSSLVVRRECLASRRFDEKLGIWEDVELTTRLARDYHLHHVSEPLVRKYPRGKDVSAATRTDAVIDLSRSLIEKRANTALPKGHGVESLSEGHLSSTAWPGYKP